MLILNKTIYYLPSQIVVWLTKNSFGLIHSNKRCVSSQWVIKLSLSVWDDLLLLRNIRNVWFWSIGGERMTFTVTINSIRTWYLEIIFCVYIVYTLVKRSVQFFCHYCVFAPSYCKMGKSLILFVCAFCNWRLYYC